MIEEALAIPPAHFALMDEMMTAAFNPKHETNAFSGLPPFGGKKILFQLLPIADMQYTMMDVLHANCSNKMRN